MSGSGSGGSSGDLGLGAEDRDSLDFLFGHDGPFRLPATSEEFFGTGRAEVRGWTEEGFCWRSIGLMDWIGELHGGRVAGDGSIDLWLRSHQLT